MDTISLWRRMFGGREQKPDMAPKLPPEPDTPKAATTDEARHAFQIGDRIAGRYEVHRILGGGLGSVYVVYDHKNRQALALKTFQDRPTEKHAVQRAMEESFEREALAWIRLDRHAYILRAYGVERLQGRVFIAMDFVAPDERGRTSLQDFLTGSRLPLEQVLRWGIEFCHGMEHALSKGMLCHRDIKPANILIGGDGHVKIADFGLAATLDVEVNAESGGAFDAVPPESPDGNGLTMLRVGKGQFAGTAGYMAPEVLRREGADVRSDVYAFGVVLYQMVSGVPDVPRVGRYGLAPLEKEDTALWPVIERCLQQEPRVRYPSFGLLRGELEDLIRKVGHPVPAPPKEKQLTAWEWNNKGCSLSDLGRNGEAVACYERALQIDPGLAAGWINKGNALSELRRKEEAIACYDRALEINHKCAEAWNNKGNAQLDLARQEEAIACYDRAMEINHKYAEAWNNKGKALAELGRMEEAIVCHTQAIEIDPGFALAWNNKGAALSDLGRKKEAFYCFDRALKLNPRLVNAWINMGNALSDLGSKRAAIPFFERALEIEPRHATALYNKGVALNSIGRHEEALASYRAAVEIDPRLAAAWFNLGHLLLELGRKEEAAEAYQGFIVCAPPDLCQYVQPARQLIAILKSVPTEGDRRT